MANRKRGEVPLRLGDNTYTLCLTLGALADLEDAFGVTDLQALADRFGSGRLSSRDLLTILQAALRGGGHGMTESEVANLPLGEGVGALAAAIADLLIATFGAAPSGSTANPPQPQHP